MTYAAGRRLRVAIAGFKLESVTFLPNLTTLADFQAAECSGIKLIDEHRGANTPVGGFIAVCEREGVEMVPIVYAEVGAAGPASDEAFDHYLGRILDGLKDVDVDGVLLDLHGAMTTPTRMDAEADIFAAVRRQVGGKTRIMAALDYHANLDESTLLDADAAFGYHFSPHIDQAETGERAAQCMVRTLRGELDPAWAIVKPDLMVPSIFSATSLEPLAGLVQDSIRVARDCAVYLDVSVFAGFSYADVPNCGFSVLAVTDGDREFARKTATGFSNTIRDSRPAFSHGELVLGISEGIAQAVRIAEHSSAPVVLLEHADRMGDSTYLLREVVARQLGRTAVPFLWDPQAVAIATTAGIGAQVRLPVGGHSSERAGGAVTVEGKVVFAGPKSYHVTGPYYTGRLANLGDTVVIDAGFLVLSITSRQFVAVDEDCFTQFGMRASEFDFIVLRSKTHFRAVYESLAAAIVIVDTPDWGPADLTTLKYVHVALDRTYPFSDAA
ncbi:MAG: M81 family metallopeptidase [Burkholderiaceae bacterium]|nr:M81 family metallopeptidase [Burkholderiaceae bacterium]